MTGHQFLTTIALLLSLLFALALCGRDYWEPEQQSSLPFMLEAAESQAVGPCMDENTRERVRAILIDALDDALKEQVMHLFEVWMKDDRGQPARARVGVIQAVKAHQDARKAALEWMPPACSN